MQPFQTPSSVAPRKEINLLREFQGLEVNYLLSLVGKGEDPNLANNQSEFLRMMRSTDGTGKGPEGEAWCAVTRSHAGVRTAGVTLSQLPYVPHRGARRLTKNIATAGGWIIKPGTDTSRTVVLPKGAALCKKTGPIWKGHFMTVVYHDLMSDYVTIIEGNKNNRTAPDGDRYAVIDIRLLSPAQWRRDLYGVSALWVPAQP